MPLLPVDFYIAALRGKRLLVVLKDYGIDKKWDLPRMLWRVYPTERCVEQSITPFIGSTVVENMVAINIDTESQRIFTDSELYRCTLTGVLEPKTSDVFFTDGTDLLNNPLTPQVQKALLLCSQNYPLR